VILARGCLFKNVLTTFDDETCTKSVFDYHNNKSNEITTSARRDSYLVFTCCDERIVGLILYHFLREKGYILPRAEREMEIFYFCGAHTPAALCSQIKSEK